MELLWYKLPSGDEPARQFIAELRDLVGRKAILRRLVLLETGLLDDCKSLGSGLWEFRLHVGPGYRLYAGRLSEDRYLLLQAGTKSTQSRDVVQARRWWQDYESSP
jgi:putative addiction module killer protein